MTTQRISKFSAAVLALASLILIAGPIVQISNAQTTPSTFESMSEEQIEEIETRVDETRARLKLTEAQEVAVRPILEASVSDRIEVLRRYGFAQGQTPDLSFRQKLELRKEINALKDVSNQQLAVHLNETQMAEVALIQDEARAEIRARMSNRNQ